MNVNGNGATEVATTKKTGTLAGWMNDRKKSFLEAIPKGTVDLDRFMQSAILAITNPKQKNLLLCDRDSIFRALKEAASYGLELNGTLGQAYLIPYNEKGVMTCHFQMGYKGLIALARRSNTIKTIAAEPIHENDIFDIELGMNRHLSHKIDITKERGEIIAYYCLVELTNGGVQFSVKTRKDIENHRNKFSKAYNPNDKENIWNKNFDAMALKTCVIQALKLCPISIEALEAVAKEEMNDTIQDPADYQIIESDDKNVQEAEIVEQKIEKPNEPPKESKPTYQNMKPVERKKEELKTPSCMQLSPEEESKADEAFNSVNPNGQTELGFEIF